MRKLLSASGFRMALCLVCLAASFNSHGATADGKITPNEYKASQTSGNYTWYLDWDNTYLYVAIQQNGGSNLSAWTLPSVLFLDSNPASPVNSALSADGTLDGITYTDPANSNSSLTFTPPFRADRAFVFTNTGLSMYLANTNTGTWFSPANYPSALNPENDPADLHSGSQQGNTPSIIREFRVYRSAVGMEGSASAFNWFAYTLRNSTATSGGQIPINNPNPLLTSGTQVLPVSFYYTVPSMSDADRSTIFSRISYTYQDASVAPTTSPFYDFTVNAPGKTLTMNGQLVINGNFSLYQGNARMESSSNLTVVKNFLLGENASFAPSTNNFTGQYTLSVGGDFKIMGTFNTGKSTTNFTGSNQNILLSAPTKFYRLIVTKPGVKQLYNELEILQELQLKDGIINTGAYRLKMIVDGKNIMLTEDKGYVLGTVVAISKDPVSVPGNYNFGGIGLKLNANGNNGTSQGPSLGITTVTRYTGTTLYGQALPPYDPYNLVFAKSIKRQYVVEPTYKGENPQNPLNVNLVFTYRHDPAVPTVLVEPTELNSIVESNLALFRSNSMQGPWQLMKPPVRNLDANTVGVNGLRDFVERFIFTLGDGTAPLPVTLTSFAGKPAVGGGVQLTWNTASERNNHAFTVERQVAADRWEALAALPGKGANGGRYTYLDRKAQGSATWYYRLKQTDDNGTFTYSSVVAVITGSQAAHQLQLSPVPTADMLTLSNLPDGAKELVILDQLGRVQLRQAVTGTTATVSVSALSPSTYSVRILGASTVQNARFIKR
ncbi:T9SS type A sorting domain-containing protein [Hymenobacter sp. DG25A]|uniref:T9SS type A sorting domain-containing protein n=1 Tax=Hymenobacter sp. DG25A TaxID=1385663 RepID=UPI000A9280B6|nr:T9SS type A sorting domain-containing protein [Hymenobacter sp. DG25A]